MAFSLTPFAGQSILYSLQQRENARRSCQESIVRSELMPQRRGEFKGKLRLPPGENFTFPHLWSTLLHPTSPSQLSTRTTITVQAARVPSETKTTLTAMVPNSNFNLPFRPSKKPVAAGRPTLCFRPKASSTNAAVAKTSATKIKHGDDAAKKALKRVLESALGNKSTPPVDKVDFDSSLRSTYEHGMEVATFHRVPDPDVSEVEKDLDAGERAYREAFQEIEWDELIEKKTLKRERADAKKQKIKRAVEAEKARSNLAKAKHNEDEMLSMLSGFKVSRKRDSLRKATGTGISKASRFKTPTVDYAKLQRQGKALVKATQDKILPSSSFWRESLETQKDKNAHIENAVKNATYLQASRIRVHSYAAWSRAKRTGDTNEDGTPKLLR